jgi:predicted ATPase
MAQRLEHPVIAHNFPPQPTSFVGRDTELKQIRQLLSDSGCRLLTLFGPGGIGKTRLALETARILFDGAGVGGHGRVPLPMFADAICFAPLQSLTSPDFITSALAEALRLPFSGSDNAIEQLLTFFSDKSLLLVLDNCEHLLDGIGIVSDILHYAPGVKFLATSRERLNLREEWVYEVHGLAFPASEFETHIVDYDAVRLFVHHARRTHAGFTLTHSHKPAVTRICRMVDGMPLGIELASAWVRALSCDQIADEIARSLDILETPSRNVEPRHRNLRAAFEPTWNRLSEDERSVFRKVSVFRGGFSREAAEYVAGASLRALSSLVDKALLRVNANGRYDLHELLRQYGQERLNQSSDEREAVLDLHSAYYLDFMRRCEDMLAFQGRQKEAMQGIEQELSNVRVAWQRAVVQGQFEEIERSYGGFNCFYS